MKRILSALVIFAVAFFAEADTQGVFKDNVNSVVIVKSKKLKDNKPVLGVGTGFFVSKRIVLTSLHVVYQSTEIEIETYDGRVSKARMIGYDRLADLVILEVDIDGPPVNLRKTPLEIGEDVIVIGHPRSFFYSVSKGVVSHNERYGISSPLVRYTQIDASVNPGNSGGPVFDSNGYVVGIVQAIISDTKSFSGLSFIYDSIGIFKSMNLIEDATDNVASRPYLGVSYTYIRNNSDMPKEMFSGKGVYVTSVEKGSPAWLGHLRPGDRIVAINGTPYSSTSEMFKALSNVKAGAVIQLDILRNNKPKTLSITTGSKK